MCQVVWKLRLRIFRRTKTSIRVLCSTVVVRITVENISISASETSEICQEESFLLFHCQGRNTVRVRRDEASVPDILHGEYSCRYIRTKVNDIQPTFRGPVSRSYAGCDKVVADSDVRVCFHGRNDLPEFTKIVIWTVCWRPMFMSSNISR